jgi:uroporphyrinogen decarboxylase
MGMFDHAGRTVGASSRNANTLAKLTRMRTALSHREPDRVPISDFFWGGFIRRWREELGLPADASPYYHYDLDWICTVPNMDPWIRSFETITETPEEVVVKTGFGAHMRKVFHLPMPEFIGWEIDTLEKLEEAIGSFDSPQDRRRYCEAGDNQIAGVGDGFERNTPAWLGTVESLWPDFPVFGSMLECTECMTRLVGPVNHMTWAGLEPERMGAVIARLGQFHLDCVKAQVAAAQGRLDGFVIWGDIAYKNGTFMRPSYWRQHYKPWVQAMVEHCHAHGLMVIYHGCGNVHAIRPISPRWGSTPTIRSRSRRAWMWWTCAAGTATTSASAATATCRCGSAGTARRSSARCCANSTPRGAGAMIFQSDHSVASDVSGLTYDYIVKLVREPPLVSPYATSASR